MKDLIHIHLQAIGTEQMPTVNARDLHAFLEVRWDFTTWIKRRIAKYGFVEGEDYEVFHKFVENPQGDRGGRPTDEYQLTIDMAKELAMVENNERGRQARRYFIECERRLHSSEPNKALDTNWLDPIKQFMVVLKANKALGVPLQVAVEQSRQTMRNRGIDIDALLPMPRPSSFCKDNAEKDAAARDRIFSIIQSKGSVPQGTLFNRCRSMNKADFQKHIDVLLVQNKIQQVVLEHPATKKRFNCYRMSGALN